ncbi:MAG: cytochrome bc1 complex diheme cytochrome c subunit [Acidimicrobiales bacterium]
MKARFALPSALVALTAGVGLVLFSGPAALATSSASYSTGATSPASSDPTTTPLPPSSFDSNTVTSTTTPSSTAASDVPGGQAPPTPTDPQLALGQTLFVASCSSCHGLGASGTQRGPNLLGLGTATIDFWVSTGRMPLADSSAQAIRKPPRFNRSETLAIDNYVNSLSPGGQAIPTVDIANSNLAQGGDLFTLNCAGCHTITGAGDALANGTYAPSLSQATPTQIVEALRTGPGNMPRFAPGSISNQQANDIAKYVTYLRHPNDRGGAGLGHVGPVTEGFIGILIGLGGLMLVIFWMGDRA